MNSDDLLDLLRKHFYIIYKDKLENPDGNLVIEKMVAKHSLLKPEFLIINDEVQGFKKISKRVSSLEKFPIFIEVEWFRDDNGGMLLENIDIFCEADLSCQSRLSDVIYIANVYSKTVSLERVIRVTEGNQESIAIFSRLPEYLTEELIKNELEDYMDTELFVPSSAEDTLSAFNHYLKSFVNFIKIMDDVLVKNKPLGSLKHILDELKENDGEK